MSKVGSWNTTAGSNNATPPDGWPEGQAPSTVNDCAREMMAQIKVMVNSLEYIDLNNTPSFLTATTFSMATADVANFEVGRRVKLFDTNTMYGTIISVSATQVQVRLDYHTAQSALTASLSSIAMAVLKSSNNSIPDNAWKRKNVIINGSMDIWQRSASFQPANNTITYTADRWSINMSTGGALAISRSERSANASNVPALAQSGVFFTNSLLISVSAADAAVAAGEFVTLDYKIEGYDWRQIAHKPINLSFWVNTRQSGTYAVALQNTGSDRSFVQNYTISAIAAWTKVSIPVPEALTTGTWDYSSGVGLRVRFVLEGGATYQGGAGNWTVANILCTSSQVNFLQSAGNTFALTGVQLEEGQFATPLETRHYNTEATLCKRYCQTIPDNLTPTARYFGHAISTSRVIYYVPLDEMRAAPSITYPNPADLYASNNAAAEFSVSAITGLNTSSKQLIFDAAIVGTPVVAGDGSFLRISAGARAIIDAELS